MNTSVGPTMGIEQCAELIKVHRVTLSKMAARGDIPATKVGRRWVFMTELVLDWLKSRTLPKPQASQIQLAPAKRGRHRNPLPELF